MNGTVYIDIQKDDNSYYIQTDKIISLYVPIIIRGEILKLETISLSGHKYSKSIFEKQVNLLQKSIRERRFLGFIVKSLDDFIENDCFFKLNTMSHIINKLYIEDSSLMIQMEILPTRAGNIIRRKIRKNEKITVCLWNYGNVDLNNNVTDFEIITAVFDGIDY